MQPETQCARNENGYVAYQVVRDGPLELVVVPSWVSNVAGLPGPGATAVPATADICLLPEVCVTLCSPFTLGSLRPVVCGLYDTLCLP